MGIQSVGMCVGGGVRGAWIVGRKLRLSHLLGLGDQLDSSSWWPLNGNLLHDTTRFTVMPSWGSITKSTSMGSGLDGCFRERRGLQQSNMQTMKDRSPEVAKMSRACFLERKREVEERVPMTTFKENLLVLNKRGTETSVRRNVCSLFPLKGEKGPETPWRHVC